MAAGDDLHVVSSTATAGASGIVFVPDSVTENPGEGLDTVTCADVLAISSSTDILRVDGNADDTFGIADIGGWTQEADQAIGSGIYRTYTQASATLLVDADLTPFTPL